MNASLLMQASRAELPTAQNVGTYRDYDDDHNDQDGAAESSLHERQPANTAPIQKCVKNGKTVYGNEGC